MGKKVMSVAEYEAAAGTALETSHPGKPDIFEEPKKRAPRKALLTEYALIHVPTDMIMLGTSNPARIRAAMKAAKLQEGVQYQIVRLGPIFEAKNIVTTKQEILFQ